jgi:diguanylate cyclase (GGDEF)-like protein
LIAAGIFLATIGEFGLGGVGLADQAPAITKWDFLLFVSGIPFAVAISCASEEVGLTSFPWVDGAIVALTVAFGFLLLLTGTIGWVSLPLLSSRDFRNLYIVESCVLALACTVRLASSFRGETRRVFFILAALLWISALLVIFQSMFTFRGNLGALFCGIGAQVAPIMLLVGLAFWPEPKTARSWEVTGPSTSDFLVDHLGTLSLTIIMVVLVSEIDHRYFAIKSVLISTAVILIGVRTVLRHREYWRVHMEISEHRTIRDGLTGAYNRRHFDQMLREEWKRANRINQHLSLILMDVDFFKALNDRYGHPTGDAVLRAIVRSLTAVLRRPGDLLARYGGEEFAIILPGGDLAGAKRVAEHIRDIVESRKMPNEGSLIAPYVTLSIGLVCKEPNEESSPQEMLDRADAALYKAKSEGRNRIST